MSFKMFASGVVFFASAVMNLNVIFDSALSREIFVRYIFLDFLVMAIVEHLVMGCLSMNPDLFSLELPAMFCLR